MEPEELLKPRYEVIADYPNTYYDIGDIVYSGKDDCDEFFRTFPAIFSHLPWWAKRQKSFLPEYVKCIQTPDQKIMPGMVLKITDWFSENCGRFDGGICVLETNCFLPATEQDYTSYIKSKTP